MAESALENGRETATDAEARAHVRAVTEGSGSSFFGAMRVLPMVKREAMYAIYAFCREVDDIADEPGPTPEKLQRLAEWRQEIDRLFDGRPEFPTGRALLKPVRRFDLQKRDFLAMIEGMEMDASETLRLPDLSTLEHYCACVAGAVGMLSVRVFDSGSSAAERLAWCEGQALQLTNILRDIAEDAERGRLYLPAELLERHGISDTDPAEVLRHAALPQVCADLAELARQRFQEAETALSACNRRKMRPAIVMMHVYRRYLDLMMARGWERFAEPIRVSKLEKLWIAFRYGVL